MTAIEKCRDALTKSKSLTLYQAIAATRLDGWDASQALNRLVELNEATRSTDDGATVWCLKNRVEVIQTTDTVIGKPASVENITGKVAPG
jgi:hypothetical protein